MLGVGDAGVFQARECILISGEKKTISAYLDMALYAHDEHAPTQLTTMELWV